MGTAPHRRRARGHGPGPARQPALSAGQTAPARDSQRLVHGARLHRPRPHARQLHHHGGRDHGRQPGQGRRLPVRRVPHRPAPREQPRQPRAVGDGERSRDQRRPGSGRPAGARGGTRPGERRPGTPGRLLHGFPGHAQRAGDRLRHPLRVRHLRSGDPRRVAGRADRQVASLRQPLGDRPVGDQLRRAVRRPHRLVPGRSRRAPGAVGAGSRRQGRRLRHARPRLPDPVDQPAAAVESRSHGVVRLRRVQRRRLLRRRRREGGVGDDLEGALPERRARGRQAAAPAAAVLLRLLLAAGHDPPPSRPRRPARRSRRVVGGSAQRHPPRRSPSPS